MSASRYAHRPARASRPAFEVQTRFRGDTWENCWTDDGRPSRFASRSAAEDALHLYLRDLEQSALDGDIFDDYPVQDFRIAAVQP